jgi:hypothetical protein
MGSAEPTTRNQSFLQPSSPEFPFHADMHDGATRQEKLGNSAALHPQMAGRSERARYTNQKPLTVARKSMESSGTLVVTLRHNPSHSTTPPTAPGV